MDLALVLESDEQRTFEELGHGMGMEDNDVRLMAAGLDLCRYELTGVPGHCCHRC